MIRKKAISKILLTTMFLFIILFSYSINKINNKDNIKPTFDYVNMDTNASLYLLDNNNLLVKYDIFLIDLNPKNLLDSYKNNLPNNLKSPLRNKLKFDKIKSTDNEIYVYLNIKPNIKEEEAISYSLFSLEGIDKVNFYINSSFYKSNNKNLGINKDILLNDKNNIKTVTVFYNENIDDNSYFVPVTKYINSSKNKIDIIIEELTSNYIYEDNLASTLANAKINNYRFDNNVLFVEFNSFVNKKDLDGLTNSLFFNTSTESVIYTCKGKIIDSVNKLKK